MEYTGDIGTKYHISDRDYNGVWLVIDEFNRADIDRSFRSLITALRTHWIRLPSNRKNESYTAVKIPKDFRIICTINTTDKHFLFKLSDALKSRFAFIEINTPIAQTKTDDDSEIYYAMKNAIKSIEMVPAKWESLFILDHSDKIIRSSDTSRDFFEIYTKFTIYKICENL